MTLTEFKLKWLNNFGYLPTNDEIINAYHYGYITLTDKEENELINYLEKL